MQESGDEGPEQRVRLVPVPVLSTRYHPDVFNGFDFDELYDLQADPHELRNLAADAAAGPLKRDLARRMWQLARAENDTAINPYITVGLAPVGPGAVADSGG